MTHFQMKILLCNANAICGRENTHLQSGCRLAQVTTFVLKALTHTIKRFYILG